MAAIISLPENGRATVRPAMIKGTLRVLVLEGTEGVGDRFIEELERGVGRLAVTRVVGESAFSAAVRTAAPDVVLAAPTPGGFGPTGALRAIRAEKPAVPLIIVAEALDEQEAIDGLRGGADDCVLTGNIGRLVPAISAALDVRRPLTRLSPRQLEVLRMVAEGRSTREIAERLTLSMKTVESHRGAVMKRLELHNVADLVRYAVHTGMVSADVRGTPRGSRRSPISTPQPEE
jgi:DNA-binding NarL/FixJ family response regulator